MVFFFNVFHGTPYSTLKKLFPYIHKRERKKEKEAERVKEDSPFNNIKDYLRAYPTDFMFKYNSNNNYYNILKVVEPLARRFISQNSRGWVRLCSPCHFQEPAPHKDVFLHFLTTVLF